LKIAEQTSVYAVRFQKMAALCAAIFIFYPSLLALYYRWEEPVSYFDHAIFVPFVCAWMAYRVPTRGARSARSNLLLGFCVGLFALLLQWIGVAQQVTVMQGSALVLGIWASVLWFGGIKAFKRYRWPLLYLLLLIPIPTFFMAQMTIGMRELSTSLAAHALGAITSMMGSPFFRSGNVLNFAGHKVTIVDACSGMNTLMTVIAVGMVLVYLETSRAKAWVTTVLLVPTAIIANLFRILVLCAFVAAGQSEFAFGAGHAAIGMTTVGLAIFLLEFGIRIPARWDRKPRRMGSADENTTADTHQPSHYRLALFTTFLLCAALISGRVRSMGLDLEGGHGASGTQLRSSVLPPLDLPGWKSHELPMDRATYEIVGTRNAHMYRFDRTQAPSLDKAEATDSLPVYLYWVHSENSRKIGHPPELCYRAESYEISDKSQRELSVEGKVIPINRLVVQRGNYRLLVYYWYRIGGVDTASYLEQQARWAWNELRSIITGGSPTGAAQGSREGTMIRISTPIENGVPEQLAVTHAEKRLESWVSQERQQDL
jgi:EpsI family protein